MGHSSYSAAPIVVYGSQFIQCCTHCGVWVTVQTVLHPLWCMGHTSYSAAPIVVYGSQFRQTVLHPLWCMGHSSDSAAPIVVYGSQFRQCCTHCGVWVTVQTDNATPTVVYGSQFRLKPETCNRWLSPSSSRSSSLTPASCSTLSSLSPPSSLHKWYVYPRKANRLAVHDYESHQLSAGPVVVVGWLLNVPATCECISGTDLLGQFYVLPHWDRSSRSNFLPHPVTVNWHRADQSQRWSYNNRRLAG